MFGTTEMLMLVALLLALVFTGVHIAVSLGMAAVAGIYLMTGDAMVVFDFIGSTAYEALRDYVFAVIPLFMLMGEFISKCGAAKDMFTLINRLTSRIPGRLGVATVLSNAVFAFVTGVSIAAAAAFSKIAYPEMKRYGYNRHFALGCIAGSACLGMLIPPSVLMIVWAVLTEISIGDLFLAGILPGFLLVSFFTLYIVGTAMVRPDMVGEQVKQRTAAETVAVREPLAIAMFSTLLVIGLVIGTLMGIWLGFFTPTEGAGVGAAAALLIAMFKGMRYSGIREVVLSVGRTTAPLLLLLFTAQLYSRVLTMTGFTRAMQELLIGTGLGPWGILALMVLIWFILGCIIDSISIILLTVPIFAPIAAALGFDPLAFAIIGIIAIETGLLTPPFGLLIYTIKAALPDEPIVPGKIFLSAVPYWLALIAVVICLAVFPEIATYLPKSFKSL